MGIERNERDTARKGKDMEGKFDETLKCLYTRNCEMAPVQPGLALGTSSQEKKGEERNR